MSHFIGSSLSGDYGYLEFGIIVFLCSLSFAVLIILVTTTLLSLTGEGFMGEAKWKNKYRVVPRKTVEWYDTHNIRKCSSTS